MQHIEESYHVKLDSFTGPLDLLLHLIRKHEIDIYDIPIALITQQYLEYLNFMKTLNLSFAGEFIVMAATLVQIKSRLLLPRESKQVVEGGDENEAADPRDELVRRLVEYQQYKEASSRLFEQERLWRDVFQRGPTPNSEKHVRDVLLDEVGLFDLLDVLQDVMKRTSARQLMEVTYDTVTVQDRINAVLERLEEESAVTFSSLFKDVQEKVVVIVTFLALLELVRMRLVRVYQVDFFGPIRIARAFLPGRGGTVSSCSNGDDSLEFTNGGSDAEGFS